jgi:hypothetical protein
MEDAMEQEQAKFEGWAIIEMMGHQREIGYVTTEAYGVAVLFRVDVPLLPDRECVLERPEYDSERMDYLPKGAKVQRKGFPARTRLIAPAAVYAINPCTEEAARKAIEASVSRSLVLLEMPQDKLLVDSNPIEAEEDFIEDDDENAEANVS